jgi:hypothetical protein
MVIGRVEERSLQRRDRPVDGALAQAGDASQRLLGGAAKGLSGMKGKRAGEAGD